jgi:hypothetical protein
MLLGLVAEHAAAVFTADVFEKYLLSALIAMKRLHQIFSMKECGYQSVAWSQQGDQCIASWRFAEIV